MVKLAPFLFAAASADFIQRIREELFTETADGFQLHFEPYAEVTYSHGDNREGHYDNVLVEVNSPINNKLAYRLEANLLDNPMKAELKFHHCVDLTNLRFPSLGYNLNAFNRVDQDLSMTFDRKNFDFSLTEGFKFFKADGTINNANYALSGYINAQKNAKTASGSIQGVYTQTTDLDAVANPILFNMFDKAWPSKTEFGVKASANLALCNTYSPECTGQFGLFLKNSAINRNFGIRANGLGNGVQLRILSKSENSKPLQVSIKLLNNEKVNALQLLYRGNGYVCNSIGLCNEFVVLQVPNKAGRTELLTTYKRLSKPFIAFSKDVASAYSFCQANGKTIKECSLALLAWADVTLANLDEEEIQILPLVQKLNVESELFEHHAGEKLSSFLETGAAYLESNILELLETMSTKVKETRETTRFIVSKRVGNMVAEQFKNSFKTY